MATDKYRKVRKMSVGKVDWATWTTNEIDYEFYSFLIVKYSRVPLGSHVPFSKSEISPLNVFSISSVLDGTM